MAEPGGTRGDTLLRARDLLMAAAEQQQEEEQEEEVMSAGGPGCRRRPRRRGRWAKRGGSGSNQVLVRRIDGGFDRDGAE